MPAMVEATITKLNLESRTVVVVDGAGQEHTVTVSKDANIEVVEHETMGTQSGELEDLDVGYLVTLAIGDHDENGICQCAEIACIS